MSVTPNFVRRVANLLPAMKGMRRSSAEAVGVGLVGQGALVITGVLLARQLGPQQRGYAALLMLWPVLVTQIGEFGLPNAAAYFIAREPRSFQQILRHVRFLANRQLPILVACHVAILAVFLVGKPPTVLGPALLTIVSVPAMMAADYGLAMLQGQQRFRSLNLLRLVNPALLCPSLLVLAIAHRTTLFTAVAALILSLFASGAALLFAALQFRPSAPSINIEVSNRDLFRFGFQGLLGSTYPAEAFRIDQLAVGIFLSPAALGLYVVGFAFTNVPTLISQGFALIAYPGVAGAAGYRRRREIIWQFFLLFASVSVATVVVLEGTIAVLIPFFFGNQFAPSIQIARVALVGGLLLSARRLLAETLRGAGYPVAGTLAEASLLVVLLPALVVGGYFWGPQGMAGAVAVAAFASLLVLVVFEARAMKRSASAQPNVL